MFFLSHSDTDQQTPIPNGGSNSSIIAGIIAGVFILLTLLLVIFGIIVSSIILLYSRYAIKSNQML